MKPCTVSALFVVLLTFQSSLHAEELPRPSIAAMCERVELIVEGVWKGADRVAVTRVWKAPQDFARNVQQISVAGLTKVTRTPTDFLQLKPAAKPIATMDVILFLVRDEQKLNWIPLYTFENGSSGVFWVDDRFCYGYVQIQNPGDYLLISSEDSTWWEEIYGFRSPSAGPGGLRKAIEHGLAARERFAAHVAISDPAKRARFLVRYLSLRNTPDPTGAHQHVAVQALTDIKKEAREVLIKAIEAAPAEDDLRGMIDALAPLGPDLAEAKPALLKVLSRKDRNAMPAIYRLEKIGDAAVVPQIRDCLRATDPSVRAAAAHALVAFNDRQSFDAIAAMIPRITAENMYHVFEMLTYLRSLDPERVRAVAYKVAPDPVPEPIRERIAGFKKP